MREAKKWHLISVENHEQFLSSMAHIFSMQEPFGGLYSRVTHNAKLAFTGTSDTGCQKTT